MRRGLPPALLRLQQVQRRADDEAAAAHDLRDPVRRVEPPLRRQVVDDARKSCDARDAEHGGAEELRRPGQEA